jgi:hypothetical protein
MSEGFIILTAALAVALANIFGIEFCFTIFWWSVACGLSITLAWFLIDKYWRYDGKPKRPSQAGNKRR